jgi:hypothetical protein
MKINAVRVSLVTAQGLDLGSHPESGGASNRSEYDRGVYFKLRWTQ